MCLIIDANCAVDTLSASPSAAFEPVMATISKKNAAMVMGGTKLRAEYKKLSSVWRFIVALDQAGKAKTYSDAEVDAAQANLESAGLLKSDDPHIVALAQVSGARLLCSRDQDLHQDFRDKSFVDNPRGNVYQNQSHSRLLRKC